MGNNRQTEIIDWRLQLDRERRLRMLLEEQVRLLEAQIYPTDRMREMVQLQYQQTLVEETVVEEMEVPLPLVTESEDNLTDIELIPPSDILTSSVVGGQERGGEEEDQQQQQQQELPEQNLQATCCDEEEEEEEEDIVLRLPTVVVDAEPKVEVERLTSPVTSGDEVSTTSTSRQNLETIVEAIRHLEGDHLFNDIPSPPTATTTGTSSACHRVIEEPVQEVPLALTTKQTPQRLIKVSLPTIDSSSAS